MAANRLKKNAEKSVLALVCVTVSEIAAVWLHSKTGVEKTYLVPAIAGAIAGMYNYLKHRFF